MPQEYGGKFTPKIIFLHPSLPFSIITNVLKLFEIIQQFELKMINFSMFFCLLCSFPPNCFSCPSFTPQYWCWHFHWIVSRWSVPEVSSLSLVLSKTPHFISPTEATRPSAVRHYCKWGRHTQNLIPSRDKRLVYLLSWGWIKSTVVAGIASLLYRKVQLA